MIIKLKLSILKVYTYSASMGDTPRKNSRDVSCRILLLPTRSLLFVVFYSFYFLMSLPSFPFPTFLIIALFYNLDVISGLSLDAAGSPGTYLSAELNKIRIYPADMNQLGDAAECVSGVIGADTATFSFSGVDYDPTLLPDRMYHPTWTTDFLKQYAGWFQGIGAGVRSGDMISQVFFPTDGVYSMDRLFDDYGSVTVDGIVYPSTKAQVHQILTVQFTTTAGWKPVRIQATDTGGARCFAVVIKDASGTVIWNALESLKRMYLEYVVKPGVSTAAINTFASSVKQQVSDYNNYI